MPNDTISKIKLPGNNTVYNIRDNTKITAPSSASNNDVLTYNSTTQKWEAKASMGGGVVSIDGKTGAFTLGNNITVDNSNQINVSVPTVPTNVSAFTNDANYLTSSGAVTSFGTKTGAITLGTNLSMSGNQLNATFSGGGTNIVVQSTQPTQSTGDMWFKTL